MFCAECGQEVEAGRSFCRFCGAPVQPGRGEQTPRQYVGAPREPPRKRTAMWAFVAGLVFVVCAGAAIAAYLVLRDDGGGSSTGSSDIAASTTAGSGATTTGDTATGGTAGGGTTSSTGATPSVDLSPLVTINVSSTLATQGSVDYGKGNLIDKEPSTCWAEGVPGYGIGEFIEFTFSSPVTVREIRIVPGYDKVADGWDRWPSNGRVRSFDLSFSDGTHEAYSADDSRDLQIITLSASHTVTSMRLTIAGAYEAVEGPHKAEDTSVSELHVWGTE